MTKGRFTAKTLTAVILSRAKNLCFAVGEILRVAQDDTWQTASFSVTLRRVT